MRNNQRGRNDRNQQGGRRPQRQERPTWNRGGDATDAPLAGLHFMLSRIGPVPSAILAK